MASYLDYIAVTSCHKYRQNIFRSPPECHSREAGNTVSEEYDELFLSYEAAQEHQFSRIRSYYQCPQCNFSFKYKKEPNWLKIKKNEFSALFSKNSKKSEFDPFV